jgi:anaerobic selenocysteine-containing dehydrogenase
MKVLNTKIYGQELADTYDSYYQESIAEDWFPDYSKHGWKMGIFAGNNGANWRAAGSVWRKNAFEELETIVSLAPDMGVTSFYSDYVLPIAHHYERDD